MMDINRFTIEHIDTSKITREDWHIEFNESGNHWIYLTIGDVELSVCANKYVKMKKDFRTIENDTEMSDNLFIIDQIATMENAISDLELPCNYRRRTRND